MKGPQAFSRLVHSHNIENILRFMLFYDYFFHFVILLVLPSKVIFFKLKFKYTLCVWRKEV